MTSNERMEWNLPLEYINYFIVIDYPESNNTDVIKDTDNSPGLSNPTGKEYCKYKGI